MPIINLTEGGEPREIDGYVVRVLKIRGNKVRLVLDRLDDEDSVEMEKRFPSCPDNE